MDKIILASNNINKISEVKSILEGYEVLSLKDIGFTEDIKEEGTTFLENALIKAKSVRDFARKHNYPYDIIADDSGLCCKGLDNKPGIYSARYAGNHNEKANRDKLRKELDGKNRDAAYVCYVVLYHQDGTYEYEWDKVEGEIINEEKGTEGFGYDPIFFSKELQKTYGEAKQEEKDKISHRRRAIKRLIKFIRN